MRTRWLAAVACCATLAAADAPGPEARAREFVALLAKHDFAPAQALFDDSLRAQLTPAALEQAWGQLQKAGGTFQKTGAARVESSAKNDVVFLTLEFEKMQFDARLPVDKAGRIGGLKFDLHTEYIAPDYVRTAAFHEREAMVGEGDWAVHGTLSIPNGDGPFPAVILVHGSGAADRDYSYGPNKMFRDLAWGLASRGVAVLRYNKRANEHGREVAADDHLTVKEETIDDAVAAVTVLWGASEIDRKRIFAIGHSLGATLMPRIGKADPRLAGMILMAGTVHDYLNLLVSQTEYNFTLHGPMSAAQQKQLDRLRAQVARAADPALTADAPRSSMPLGSPASYWLDLRGYHPEQVARQLPQPMLLLQGERDYQVTMEDFALWKKGLEGKKNVDFKSYPKLNHLFLSGEGPSSDEEYLRPGHLPKEVVEDIAAWIERR